MKCAVVRGGGCTRAALGCRRRLVVSLGVCTRLTLTRGVLGRYTFVSKLGMGQQGAVYAAVHMQSGRTTAIKYQPTNDRQACEVRPSFYPSNIDPGASCPRIESRQTCDQLRVLLAHVHAAAHFTVVVASMRVLTRTQVTVVSRACGTCFESGSCHSLPVTTLPFVLCNVVAPNPHNRERRLPVGQAAPTDRTGRRLLRKSFLSGLSV